MAKKSSSKASGSQSRLSSTAKRFTDRKVTYSEDALKVTKNESLAMDLAKTKDKKSKTYKAALRNVQRWKKGTTKPSKQAQENIEKHIKKNPELKRKLLKSQPSITVSIDGEIVISDDARYRNISETLSPSKARKFLSLAETSSDDALKYFFDDVYGAQGMFSVDAKVTIEE